MKDNTEIKINILNRKYQYTRSIINRLGIKFKREAGYKSVTYSVIVNNEVYTYIAKNFLSKTYRAYGKEYTTYKEAKIYVIARIVKNHFKDFNYRIPSGYLKYFSVEELRILEPQRF